MKGIELAARFSYITNSLGFCGPSEASEQFLSFFKNNENPELIGSQLKKFEGLYPYLYYIADKSKKELFDYEVIEAYWIGNGLLDNFNNEDLKNIIQSLTKRGLPKSIGDDLIRKLPSGMIPHHNFNVFYVGVGRITGSVEVTVQNMDNCRVSWGKVLDISAGKLIVETKSLKSKDNWLYLGKEEIKTAVYYPELLPDIRKEDTVAMHWGFAAVKLNEIQVANLMKYTQMILDKVNSV